MPCITIKNGELPSNLNAFDTYQVYNCLDSAITAQLVPVMLEQANDNHLRTYAREMRLQSLCLDMSCRGFPVSQLRMLDLLHKLEQEAAKALQCLHAFCEAVYAPKLNPRSPLQVGSFFYDFLQIPVVYKYDFKTKQRNPGQFRPSHLRYSRM